MAMSNEPTAPTGGVAPSLSQSPLASPRIPESVESWTDTVEDFIKNIKAKAQKSSDSQHAAGHKKRSRSHILIALIVIPPIILGAMVGKFGEEEWMQITSMVGLIVTGIANGIASAFDYSGKSQKHFNFNARYDDLITDIDEELAIPQEKRRSARAFMARIKTKFDCINNNAPVT